MFVKWTNTNIILNIFIQRTITKSQLLL
jgi:hypothetical protein